MRKIALFVLAAFMVGSLAGCGKKEEEKKIDISIKKDGIDVKSK